MELETLLKWKYDTKYASSSTVPLNIVQASIAQLVTTGETILPRESDQVLDESIPDFILQVSKQNFASNAYQTLVPDIHTLKMDHQTIPLTEHIPKVITMAEALYEIEEDYYRLKKEEDDLREKKLDEIEQNDFFDEEI